MSLCDRDTPSQLRCRYKSGVKQMSAWLAAHSQLDERNFLSRISMHTIARVIQYYTLERFSWINVELYRVVRRQHAMKGKITVWRLQTGQTYVVLSGCNWRNVYVQPTGQKIALVQNFPRVKLEWTKWLLHLSCSLCPRNVNCPYNKNSCVFLEMFVPLSYIHAQRFRDWIGVVLAN